MTKGNRTLSEARAFAIATYAEKLRHISLHPTARALIREVLVYAWLRGRLDAIDEISKESKHV